MESEEEKAEADNTDKGEQARSSDDEKEHDQGDGEEMIYTTETFKYYGTDSEEDEYNDDEIEYMKSMDIMIIRTPNNEMDTMVEQYKYDSERPISLLEEEEMPTSDDEVILGVFNGVAYHKDTITFTHGQSEEQTQQCLSTLLEGADVVEAYLWKEEPEQIAAGREVQEEERQLKWKKIQLHVMKEPKYRPEYHPAEKRCLSILIKVNGLEGRALWDSGSTSTLMSPAFALIVKAVTFQLAKPITLQLGTIGSRSKINHGTNCFLEMSGCRSQEYFNVVNLDRYTY